MKGNEIEILAKEKLFEINKLNDIIGTQIFQIIDKYANVLFYPLDDENEIWGFVAKKSGQNFICINTSIEYPKQIFVAAHELFHIISSSENYQILESDLMNINNKDKEELNANRFAAAFLVNEDLLKREIINWKIDVKKISLKDILMLANIFVVPYKSMVKRLYELKEIKKNIYDKFINKKPDEINKEKKILGVIEPQQKNNIKLNNLTEKSIQLYNKKLITISKLEQLVGYSQLSLEDVGIKKPTKTIPLSDEEIEKLLEE